MKAFIHVVVLICFTVSLHSAEIWRTNFDAALAEAQQSGKDLLVDFTGSDWCGWCIRLDEEVFEHEAFLTEAQKKYVLVKIDFPMDKSQQSKDLQAQNKALQQRYEVEGYPTIILLDSMGEQYGRTGYHEGGVDAYLSHLATFKDGPQRRDAALARIQELQGVAQSESIVSLLNDELASTLSGQQQQELYSLLIANDPENKRGDKLKYSIEHILGELRETQDMEQAEEKLQFLLPMSAETPDQRQLIYYFLAGISMELQKDQDIVRTYLEKAVSVATDSALAKKIQVDILPSLTK